MSASLVEKYGPWVAVTGGGRGIGGEIAAQCSERGLNAALLDIDGELAKSTAKKLADQYGVKACGIEFDAAQDNVVEAFEAALQEAVPDIDLGILVNNAGLGLTGPFAGHGQAHLQTVVNLNVRTPTLLINHYAKQFAARGRGAFLITSSAIGETPTPFFAQYAATKAYLTWLAEALFFEWRKLPLDILALLPGQTDTPGYRATQPVDDNYQGGAMSAQECVSVIWDALGKQASVMPGEVNLQRARELSSLPRSEAVAQIYEGMLQVFGEDVSKS